MVSATGKSHDRPYQKLLRNQGKVLPAVFNVFGGLDYQNIFDSKYNLENSPLNRDNFDEYFFTISDTTFFEGDSVFVVHAVHNDTSNHWKYDTYINKENYLKITSTVTNKRGQQKIKVGKNGSNSVYKHIMIYKKRNRGKQKGSEKKKRRKK